MPEPINESVPIGEAQDLGNGRYKVVAITAGKGSSGRYPADTLREAASRNLLSRGTHSFWDHDTASGRHERPERSVRDLVGVFTSDATWDEGMQGLVAEYQVFSPYRQLFSELAEHVGLSIVGDGDVVMENGERVVKSLEHIHSVDLVTRAGRGGKVLSLLESARPSFDADDMAATSGVPVGEPIEEAAGKPVTEPGDKKFLKAMIPHHEAAVAMVAKADLTDPRVKALAAGIKSTQTGEITKMRAWLGDDAPGHSSAPAGMHMESHTHVPVVPATEARPNDTTKEGLVPELSEAEVTALRDSAALAEAARDAALAEAATAKAALAEATARQATRPAITAKVAESKTLGARTQARLVESIVANPPMTDGKVDDAKLTAAIESAVKQAEDEIADYAPARPTSVFGTFGSVAESDTPGGTAELSESDVTSAVGTLFGRKAN